MLVAFLILLYFAVLQSHNMSISAAQAKIQNLQQQLSLLKEVYEERIRNGKEYESLRNIEIQIRELERTIREFLADK